MRMRGTMPGVPAALQLRPGLRLMLPEPRPVDATAVAAALDAPPSAAEPTGVQARAPQVFWGLNLWLAIHEPRSCELAEELRPGQEPRLASTPMGGEALRATYGIVSGGGIATLSADADGELVAGGYGQDAPALATDLAAHVRAWGGADHPSTQSLHIDAYPRAGGSEPPGDTMIVERSWTRFAVYHT
jgi:protein-L-isoaspartate(D-aspartate) O-methyltransferase